MSLLFLPLNTFTTSTKGKAYLQKTATKRITKDQSLEQYLFTDGTAESPFSAPPGQKRNTGDGLRGRKRRDITHRAPQPPVQQTTATPTANPENFTPPTKN